MEPSLADLRKNYERFDNDKLVRIATRDAAELRPEALELLREIIKERGISDDVERGIDAQFQEIEPAKLLEYAEILRNVPCPVCGSRSKKLNATHTATTLSVVVLTWYEKEFKIGCPDCLDAAHGKAMIKSSLLGIWAPWGLFYYVPKSLFVNAKMKKQNHHPHPNELFLSFVAGRIGEIETHRNSPDDLLAIVEKHA